MAKLEETNDGVIIRIKGTPKASKTEVVGWEGDALKVRIAAPPEKGKANEALLRFLAELFHLPKSDLSLLSGEGCRYKKILVKKKKVQDLEKYLTC